MGSTICASGPQKNKVIYVTRWIEKVLNFQYLKLLFFFSFKEALCTKTPVLFLPVFAEQGMNARNAIRLGIGSALSKYTVTKEQIVREFDRVNFQVFIL